MPTGELISDLSASAGLTGASLFEIEKSGSSEKLTGAQLLTFAGTGLFTGSTSQYILGNGSLATKITNNNQLTNGSGYVLSSGQASTVDLNTQALIAGSFNGLILSLGGGSVSNNVAIGTGSLNANTTGVANIGVGVNTLLLNTGSSNTAVGNSVLSGNTTGGNNSAFGNGAMLLNTTGTRNIAIGVSALRGNLTGTENTVSGYLAMIAGTSSYNSVYGSQAMTGSTGNENSVFGYGTLQVNSTGTGNSAFGVLAGFRNTTGSGNIFIGYNAGSYSTTDNNVFYLDNQDRTNTAGDKAKALMYGIFNAAAASQSLTINGKGILSQGLQIVGSPTAGDVWTATDTIGNGSWQPGGGTPSLTATNVGFGDGSNALTGTANLTWSQSAKEFVIYNASGYATQYLVGQMGQLYFEANSDSYVSTGGSSSIIFRPGTVETLRMTTSGLLIASGKALQLGNAATTGLTAGVLSALTNASITITDSTGQVYRIPVII